jgi:hypothetical protein
MPNEFNRKPSPKPPFSQKRKRHVEERRERAPRGGSRASPIPCVESTGASVLLLGPPLPYYHGMGREHHQFSFPPLICECVFLTVDDVYVTANNKMLVKNFGKPVLFQFSMLHTLAIGLEIKTTFPRAAPGLSIAVPGRAPLPCTN